MTNYSSYLLLLKLGLITVVLMFPWTEVLADSDSLLINVSGTILVTTCKVNNNQPVTAEFGTVLIAELDKATASVPVSITCDDDPEGAALFSINGDTTSFNKNAFKTDNNGLGITLSTPATSFGLDMPTGAVITPNTGYKVIGMSATDLTVSFTLVAHLVKDDSVKLTGGEFNGSATLLINMS